MSRLIWFHTCSSSQGQRIFLQPIITHILWLHQKWTSSCFLSKGCKLKLKPQGTSCIVLLKFIVLSARFKCISYHLGQENIGSLSYADLPNIATLLHKHQKYINILTELIWGLESGMLSSSGTQDPSFPKSWSLIFLGKLRFHHWQLFLFSWKCQDDIALEKCQFFQVKMSHGTVSAYRSKEWWSCSSLMTIMYCTCSRLLDVLLKGMQFIMDTGVFTHSGYLKCILSNILFSETFKCVEFPGVKNPRASVTADTVQSHCLYRCDGHSFMHHRFSSWSLYLH